MKRVLLFLSLLVVLLALTAEARRARPPAWKVLASTPKHNARTTFTFALKQKNEKVLEALVLEISDPDSPKYSQWLTKEEILNIVAPEPEVPLKFVRWVEEECAAFPKHIENYGDAVKVTTTVACAEKLLKIKMAVYQHKKSGVKVVRRFLDGALPSVRADLQQYLEFVSGISQLPVLRQEKNAPVKAPAPALDFVIPATARALYSIPAGARSTSSLNSQSAIEFSPEGAPMISDMVQFAQQAGETFTNISKIVGPFDVGNNGESILDVEYLTTIGSGAFTWYITIEGWVYDFALTLFNTPNPPFVNSVSYGWPEEDQCNSGVLNNNCTGITVPQYVAKANNELMKATGLGLSILVASQDEGAPSEANEGCELDGTHPLWPIYPSASPWVTAVSGTTLIGGSAVNNPPAICQEGYTCGSGSGGAIEHPCMPNETYYQWTTGGGFSKYAPRPSWQSAAVNSYLSSSALIPPTQWFMQNNRGYPDISALGSRILTIQSGSLAVTAGTSAATPIIAGVITLLNDARLRQGKKQLGFLNPMLYRAVTAKPGSYNVINAGNNKGTIGTTCEYGYGCWNGWSPVTGLGSPVYSQLLAYVLSLP